MCFSCNISGQTNRKQLLLLKAFLWELVFFVNICISCRRCPVTALHATIYIHAVFCIVSHELTFWNGGYFKDFNLFKMQHKYSAVWVLFASHIPWSIMTKTFIVFSQLSVGHYELSLDCTSWLSWFEFSLLHSPHQ